MDYLLGGPPAANRAAFQFGGPDSLNVVAHHAGAARPQTIPAGQLSLSGPEEVLDAAHWPVRGDLAHIDLAGRCFVPHYAVPMPHTVCGATAPLRRLPKGEAEELILLPRGAAFDVLDIAGGWCWGQVPIEAPGKCGFVGYIRQDQLESGT